MQQVEAFFVQIQADIPYDVKVRATLFAMRITHFI